MRHQERERMDLQLVKMSEKYKSQLFDMMDEWTKTGENIGVQGVQTR